eukprot:CAMPEP_0172639152 /NCGR_PEP_ID=MMETSP1068-20121228/217199_1 /TAXON_ID=35684 /ORGANISM="Pseudopedinella elastica, Strain CCMP716" /LENGTH=96 /DNA_ID=CAMNT_0013452213 /DNA_START=204 /DNA_END=494 /DNA_ORIENTATION=-
MTSVFSESSSSGLSSLIATALGDGKTTAVDAGSYATDSSNGKLRTVTDSGARTAAWTPVALLGSSRSTTSTRKGSGSALKLCAPEGSPTRSRQFGQ